MTLVASPTPTLQSGQSVCIAGNHRDTGTEDVNGQLVITPGDALLFLVWAGSLSLIISGVLIYALMSGSLGTAVIFMGILVSLMAGGGLDMRAFRRLRQGGRWYDMPSVRKEFF